MCYRLCKISCDCALNVQTLLSLKPVTTWQNGSIWFLPSPTRKNKRKQGTLSPEYNKNPLALNDTYTFQPLPPTKSKIRLRKVFLSWPMTPHMETFTITFFLTHYDYLFMMHLCELKIVLLDISWWYKGNKSELSYTYRATLSGKNDKIVVWNIWKCSECSDTVVENKYSST